MKNKRGEVTETITILIWLLIIAIGIVSLIFFNLNVTEPLKNTVLGEDPNSLAALESIENYSVTSIPSTFLIIFFGLLLGVIVSSFFVQTHPIFIPVYLLFAFISIFVAVHIGNIWGAFKDVAPFQEILDTNNVTGLMDLIMSNTVLISIIIFMLSMIIIFAKPGGGGSPGSGSGGGPI